MSLVNLTIINGPDKDTAERLGRIEEKLSAILTNQETFKMSFQDLKDALVAADAKADAIKADVVLLMEKLASIPVGGMTPEQEAALAEATAIAGALNEKLGVIDALNP